MKAPLLLSVVLALLVPAGASHSESARTVPVGMMTIEIRAGSLANPSVTTFSLPLRESTPPDFVGQAAGRITGVTATTLANTNAGWAPGALSQPSSPYFIRITSGNAAGRTLKISSATANTESTLTVLNQGTDLSTLGIVTGSDGDTYEIFPGDTLESFFGDSTLGATSAASADVVRLYDGSSWSDYYYNSTAQQWRIGSIPVNQNFVVLRPDSGITFYRRGSTSLTYSLFGVVPSTPIRSVVNNGGVTYLGNAFPVDQTLAASGFNTVPGWVNNVGAVTTADKIGIWGGSSYTYYNYSQSLGQWRAGSVPVNQNNVRIPAGTPVLINRPTPAPGVSVLLQDLPYNLNP